MNKLLTKIVGVALGATMAIGVGVGLAVGSNKETTKVNAASGSEFTFSEAANSGSVSSDDGNWSYSTGGTGTSPAYNAGSSELRIYVNDWIQFTGGSGVTFTSATFTIKSNQGGSGSNKAYPTGWSVDNGTYPNYSSGATSLAVTDIDASTFKISIAGSKGNVGFKKVTMNYTVAEGTKWSVTYNLNGGTGTVPTDDTEYSSSSNSVTVASGEGLTKQYHNFAGWTTDAGNTGTVYGPNTEHETYTISSDTTFYAKWDLQSGYHKGIINFGNASGSTQINSASVNGTDSNEQEWTIETVGTTSFTQSGTYSQIGKSDGPATSIQLSTTFAAAKSFKTFEAKFGGFSGTAGDISLMVSDSEVGTGSLDATTDVTVTNSHEATGTTLSIEISNIEKGVKIYFVSYIAQDYTPATGVTISKGTYSETPTISSKKINIEMGSGSGSLDEDLLATVSPGGATDKTVVWNKSGTNVGYISSWMVDNNEVMFSIDTSAEGTFTISVSANGGDSVTDSVTYTIVDSSIAALTGVTVSGTPVTPQYAGNVFNASGLTFTANHSSDSSQDHIISSGISWDLLVAGQHPQGHYTERGITIDFTIDSVTVLANTLSITIGGSMTKTSYAQNESWDPAGLTKSGQYADGSSYTGNITWSYSPETPAGLSIGSGKTVRVIATAESSESTYIDVTVTISASTFTPTEGLGAGGKFYILNYDSTYAMEGVASPSSAPLAKDLSDATKANTVMPLNFALVDDYTYEISITVEVEDVPTKFVLVNNSAATSSSNNNIKITSSPIATLKTTYWEITKGEDGYIVRQNTTGSTWRYLSFNTDNTYDFRGYTSIKTMGEVVGGNTSKQDSHLNIVAEGSYANQIANAIMSNEQGKTLCNGGTTAPSTTLWNSIAGITYIENELAILRGTDAAAKDEHGETPDGTLAEKAMARYDEIMVRYNTTTVKTYVDFLGRIEAQNLVLRASASNSIVGLGSSGTAITIIIVISSFVALTAVGGYFFIRRKKEN